MSNLQRSASILAVILCCLPLVGCWDALPLEQRDIVLGLGIDLAATDPGAKPQWEFTFVTPLFGENRAYPSQVRTVKAESLGQAVAMVHHTASRTLFFGKQAFIIFGRAAAQAGVAPHFNELLAFPELRVNSYVLVAADTAKAVLVTVPPANQRVSEQIVQMLRRADRVRDTPPITIAEFTSRMLEGGHDPISGLITPIGSLDPRPQGTKASAGGGDSDSGNGSSPGGGGSSPAEDLQIGAVALWQNDRMVGELSLANAQYLTIINGSASGLLFSLLLPPDDRLAEEPGLLQVRVLSSAAKWQLTWSDGSPHYRLRQKIYLAVNNYTGTAVITEGENAALLIDLMEQAMAENILSALQQTAQTASDPLGLGQQARIDFPTKWQAAEWPKQLSEATFEVRVQVRVRNFGTEIIGLRPQH